MRLAVGAEDEAGVVRDVQPLVAVGGPRVGALDAVHELPASTGWPRPTARTRRRRGPRRRAGARRSQALARSSHAPRVHVAGLEAHDRRPARPGSRALARALDVDGAVRVRGDRLDRVRAEPEQPERPVDRGVALLADDHPHARRSAQPVRLDVPAGASPGRDGARPRARPCSRPGRPSRSRTTPPPAGRAAPSASRRRPPRRPPPRASEVALKASWSQPVVSMSAQVAASSAPPTTKPKYLGPGRRDQRRLDRGDELRRSRRPGRRPPPAAGRRGRLAAPRSHTGGATGRSPTERR